MADTPRFRLTLLEAAQAQKHMTVNEALARLDALAGFRVEGLGRAAPPPVVDGAVWGVGPGATGAWAGEDGRLALALGGGWDFAEPWEGLRVWNAETGGWWTRLGGGWVEGVAAASPGGAATLARLREIDHTLTPGASAIVAGAIPDKAVVIGVTARVTGAISGAASWSLGVAEAPDRYGTGFGVGLGAVAEGVTGQPQAYYGGTDLVLTAAGGAFAGGAVRLAVHYLSVSAPA